MGAGSSVGFRRAVQLMARQVLLYDGPFGAALAGTLPCTASSTEIDVHREAPYMFGLLWTLSVRIRDFLRRWMPTNVLLDLIRTRRGLKWGVPAMLLAVPYFAAAKVCTDLLAGGGPGWLNLLVALFLWNGVKFAVMGPVSLVLLARVRVRELRADRELRRAVLIDQPTWVELVEP